MKTPFAVLLLAVALPAFAVDSDLSEPVKTLAPPCAAAAMLAASYYEPGNRYRMTKAEAETYTAAGQFFAGHSSRTEVAERVTEFAAHVERDREKTEAVIIYADTCVRLFEDAS